MESQIKRLLTEEEAREKVSHLVKIAYAEDRDDIPISSGDILRIGTLNKAAGKYVDSEKRFIAHMCERLGVEV